MIANAHVYEPAAGYADFARLNKAMEKQETSYWQPEPTSLFAFRNAAMEARYEMEYQDREKLWQDQQLKGPEKTEHRHDKVTRMARNPELSPEAMKLMELLK